MKTEILSKNNLKLKELKKIIKEKSDYLLIEGMKLFAEAVKSGIRIERIYVDKKNISLLSKVFPKYEQSEVIIVSNEILAASYTTESSPKKEDLILALARKPKWDIDLIIKQKKSIVYLEKIQDPGNLGTILRSSLAFDSSAVCLSKDSVDPFNTKVIRASAGAIFNMPTFTIDNFTSFHGKVKINKYKIIATKVNAKKTLNDLNTSSPSLFLFGNEGSGLSEQMVDLADEVIKIPQSIKVESLNLGVSVSLILWELYRSKE